MRILAKVKLKGRKGEKEVLMLVNSGSDFTVISEKLRAEIDPKPLGKKIELEIAGGGRIKGEIFKVRLEMEDERKIKRKLETEVVMIGSENILGNRDLSKMGAILDLRRGKIRFE